MASEASYEDRLPLHRQNARPPVRATTVTRQTRRSVKDRWYLEVIRTRLVNGACRELLSLIAVRHMTDTGYVCVPRAVLAAQLDVDEQRITRRVMEAVGAGLLTRVGGGVNGQTQQYLATLPTRQGVAERHPQPQAEVTGERHPQSDTLNHNLRVSQNDTHTYAPARACAPTETPVTTTTSAGDGPPPATRDRGTSRPPPAAAAATIQVHGHDETGDYLAGRSRLATEVGQGDHRTRARMNGRRIR
jgi:hypothetical protein